MKLPKEAIEYLIVHQSATPRAETTFEGIKKYHLSLGWGNVAYHYFVEADGRVRKGRSERTRGTHTKAAGMSSRSLGICLAGNFDEEEPTARQLAALERVLKGLAAKYKIPPDRILGHLEVPGAATHYGSLQISRLYAVTLVVIVFTNLLVALIELAERATLKWRQYQM